MCHTVTEQTTVLVLGAGAAGLAAARRLQAEGVPVIVLEARERPGGRMWSSGPEIAPYPVELGAEFIHGDHVVTWQWLTTCGLHALTDPSQYRRYWADGARLIHAHALSTPAGESLFGVLGDAAEAWLARHGTDTTFAEALREWARNHGLGEDQERWRLWATLCAISWSGDLDEVGVAGELEATYEGDGWRNFRVREGYGQLAHCMAAGLDIRYDTPVQAVHWEPAGVVVETARGIFHAQAAVVALPLGVLQRGSVRFDPPLPAALQEAIDRLHPGRALKVVVRLREQVLADEIGCVFTAEPRGIWERPGLGFGSLDTVLSFLTGGQDAARLAAAGDGAVDLALAALERPLGRRLVPLVEAAWVIDWINDPWCFGGYSFEPPGTAGLRSRFSQPVGDVLFFAGEATNVIRPATVHGAIESGEAAAARLLAALHRPVG